ncbi:MAG: nuclear transport factor 2 family protein [Cyanobacteria bacterium J06621_11]
MYPTHVHVDDQPTTSFKYSALEYSALVEVLKAYYDGLYRCDTALLAQVFHSSAQYFTASGGELLHLDMDTYFPVVEQRISPASLGEDYGFSIDSIAFVGDVTAIAQMRSSLFSKDYIDLLALIKIDGTWQIISKVFHYANQLNEKEN